jgi:D-alanyl-lipoteichoic acid acyltransferase DltB (MBOAT superfamily)
MIFNSIEFAIFLPIVFFLYWFVFIRNLKYQNTLLIVVSYIFYGWWDWRFLSLIAFSSLVDYFVGQGLLRCEMKRKRKLLLMTSILVNIGFLAVFKYYNFFVDSFADAFVFLGSPFDVDRLNIVLPVGISFYTFQTLSYSIDVYKKRIEPTKDIVSFFAFVSFFPQLIAGPIERASNLLPQFYRKRTFDYSKAADGVRQILGGLFKKIVIADNCAVYVNDVFSNYGDYSGSTLLLAMVFFSFQIYCDFSGYSDIAIGTARLFGFNLKRNFAFPYFSRDIAEFWRRWHISLSTWFRDYIYIPLGGSRAGRVKLIRNVFVIFLISGLWHGANWTFVVWGLINACFFLPLLIKKRNRRHIRTVAEGKLFPDVKDFCRIVMTFSITTLAWVFFRAETIGKAVSYISNIFSRSLFTVPEGFSLRVKFTVVFILLMLIVEWLQRNKQHALQIDDLRIPRIVRLGIYYLIVFSILVFGEDMNDFIYFQF